MPHIYTKSSPSGAKLRSELLVTSELQGEVQYVPSSMWPNCSIIGKARGRINEMGSCKEILRNAIFHSDHCSFPQETSALCSQQNSALPSLLWELHSFTQLENCWLGLLWIWWVKITNDKEMTLQQCSILMLYDHYRENTTDTFFCCLFLWWAKTNLEIDSSYIGKNSLLKCPTKGSKAIYEKQVKQESAPRDGERQREMYALLLRERSWARC